MESETPNMKLTRHTPLRRAPELTVELSAASDVELILDGERYQGNHVTLAVLDTFSTARTIEQGLEELKPRIEGARAWLDFVQHVRGCIAGACWRFPISRSRDCAATSTDSTPRRSTSGCSTTGPGPPATSKPFGKP